MTSPEAKYEAKQVVDTFVGRAGDFMSAALVWIGARTPMSTRGFLLINLVLTLLWIGLAFLLGRRYVRRTTASGLFERHPQPAMA